MYSNAHELWATAESKDVVRKKNSSEGNECVNHYEKRERRRAGWTAANVSLCCWWMCRISHAGRLLAADAGRRAANGIRWRYRAERTGRTLYPAVGSHCRHFLAAENRPQIGGARLPWRPAVAADRDCKSRRLIAAMQLRLSK